MFPNPSNTGQYSNPAIGSPPPLPIRYPPVMLKTINNNHQLQAMASPFFVDNLLQHQKAAVNFQSQFVNSQIHSYIQEQHHQFIMHQNQIRHHQAMKYAAANGHDGYMASEDFNRKATIDRISSFSPQNHSRGQSPVSNEGTSPRIDFDDDDDNQNEDKKKSLKSDKEIDVDDSKITNDTHLGKTDAKKANCDNRVYNDDNREENSHSEEDRFTEESPNASPANRAPAVKHEYQLSPTYPNRAFYTSNYQQNPKYDDKEEHASGEEAPDRRNYGKDEYQEEPENNTTNDSDQELNKPDRMKSVCSNCGSFECNPFYPSCRSYGIPNLGIRRTLESVERRVGLQGSRLSPFEDRGGGTEMTFGSPIRSESIDERMMKLGERDAHLEAMKRTSLENQSSQQKPVLKFSVNAILGNDSTVGSDRNVGANIMKIGHHEGYSVHGGGVFALPGFPLAPIAKPIASRPPAFPPHLHSLLAHCRQHPYLAVGGAGAGGVGFLGVGGGGGGGFPWAGGARGKPRRGMMRRAVFSDTQRRGLERRFQLQKYISKPDRKKLAEKLGLKDSQVKIWFQNRRMKWRNSKERELLASGGSREQTLPNKNNPHPDLSDAETDRPKLSPLSPHSTGENEDEAKKLSDKQLFETGSIRQFDGQDTLVQDRTYIGSDGQYVMGNGGRGVKSYSLMAADDAMLEEYDSDNGSGSDEEINVT